LYSVLLHPNIEHFQQAPHSTNPAMWTTLVNAEVMIKLNTFNWHYPNPISQNVSRRSYNYHNNSFTNVARAKIEKQSPKAAFNQPVKLLSITNKKGRLTLLLVAVISNILSLLIHLLKWMRYSANCDCHSQRANTQY
jgi:hypothetical protein